MYEVGYTGLGYNYRYVTDHVHKFPDTGLLKSWCKCGQQAAWNRETLKYEVQNEREQLSTTYTEDLVFG